MTRILFVDDEPRVLDGLRQSLRTKRKLWDMSFATSAADALAALAKDAFDLVVSDMRMPGMDGAELLGRVAALQPQATRMVLSGQMDEGAASRAAKVAHRFLAKPCDPETLESTIGRALELRSLLNSEHIRSCLGGVSTLPSLPAACMALNRALEDDSASVDSVARIIESDVAMASKVLQLVNSSFFGAPRTMANVSQAVSYLGMNTMRNLVLAQAMFQAFSGADVAALEREQARALLCARIARSLLPDKRLAEVAATAALLHELGSLALASRMPAEYRETHAKAERLKCSLYEVERESLGTTHAEVGAYLLGLWGLPHDVIEGVAHHHGDWAKVVRLDVVAAVRLADALSSSVLLGEAGVCLHGGPPPAALLDALGVAPKIAKVSEQIQDSMAKGAELRR